MKLEGIQRSSRIHNLMVYMLLRLEEIQTEVYVELENYKILLANPHPDAHAVVNARLRMAKLAKRRFQHITDRMVPHLHSAASTGDSENLQDAMLFIREGMNRLSKFVALWPIDRVVAEWDLYRQDCMVVVTRIERSIAMDIDRLAVILKDR